ncbi:MAG: LysR family transcriptional regulator [Myxococcales bacterium]|nr:LysR family transcriptional regulator [Myxococcales bacterium]
MSVDPQDVLVFAEVVRARGFSAAARHLDLPQSAVSRRVKRLEESLGCKLLNRTTRRVGLTPAGRVYFEHVARVPRLLDEATKAVQAIGSTPTGTLRVAAPPEDGGVIWDTLRGFVMNHPDVELEVLHSLDYVDLIDAEIDVALRGGAPPDSPDLVVHQLWDSRMLLVASPEYLERKGTPLRVEELSRHDGVCMDGWAPNALKRLSGDRGPVRVTMRNRVRSNSLTTARNAALDGLGIAPLLELTCQGDLDRGALVEVLRGALPMSAKGWYVYPVARNRSAAAQALIGHLGAVAAENLATSRQPAM